MNQEELYGRLHTWPKNRPVPEGARVLSVLDLGRCRRCGGRRRAALPQGESYCLDCLALGRVSTLDVLLTVAEPNDFVPGSKLRWTGKLTGRQETLSQRLIEHARAGNNQLLWAVTGAGKTEMLFPLIDWALSSRQRVALLSPRVDVVLELAPRLQSAFDVFTQVLYGEQEEHYRYSQLVIGTVHQMLRFYKAFDLMIIDEVDAFPYRNNRMLERALQQALKKEGSFLYLTATPSKKMLSQAKSGELVLHQLPGRFHGGKLPELTIHYDFRWRKRMTLALKKSLEKWYSEKKPFFIFVPAVDDLALIEKQVSQLAIGRGATVHATDPNRILKVTDMRAGRYDYLITTTILERGVTLPDLQAVIMGGDDPTFTKEALIQMAGRVGRSKDKPTGEVLLIASGPAGSIRRAQREIRELNRKAEENV
ncbi:DEAD/DEAH box helicase [Fructobacillus durionis]|uniref:Competence protein ComFA n=1 Tax=Fructobacillus durionis TaxID=283737 RepID=A0A1I1G5J9_9LACO|nr:DEAD/DEAH box helicase [Fructobacillus durionis]SFC07089.1 competence protein ComFA [Fructobacillus durionis]